MKNLKKLTNAIMAFALLSVFILSSCKKDDKENVPAKMNEEQIEACVDGAEIVTEQMQSMMLLSLSAAADSGYDTGEVPDLGKKKSGLVSNLGNYTWSGPDAQGWYTRSMDGVYKYSEKVRYRDTIDYIMTIEYSGADGSYKNQTTTKYIKYTKNGKELYKGFSRWTVNASGYNDISRFEWRIDFVDWNPRTNAGTYDWYWGVSENSGGETIPLYRYEHLIATDTTNSWLHVKTTWYDEDGSEIWEFEYDTPWEPVIMPEIPEIE